VWFQKISIPPPQRVIGNSEGDGVLKAKIFKGKYDLNWKFQRGGGSNQKTLHGWSMDIFWNNAMWEKLC